MVARSQLTRMMVEHHKDFSMGCGAAKLQVLGSTWTFECVFFPSSQVHVELGTMEDAKLVGRKCNF